MPHAVSALIKTADRKPSEWTISAPSSLTDQTQLTPAQLVFDVASLKDGMKEDIVGEASVFVTSIECSKCGKSHPSDAVLTTCDSCGGALLFKYDLENIANVVTKQDLMMRPDTFWKFLEMLPLASRSSIVSLGETYTPMLRLSDKGNLKNVYVRMMEDFPRALLKQGAWLLQFRN